MNVQNQTADPVFQRLCEVLTEERMGHPRSDATDRIVAAVERRRAAVHEDRVAAAPVRAQRQLLCAAALLFGFGVVVAISLLRRDPPMRSAQGAPLPPPVLVRSVAEARALPDDTANVRLRVYTPDAILALVRLRGLRRLDVSFDLDPNRLASKQPRPEFLPAAVEPLQLLTQLEELDLSGHAPIVGIERLSTLRRLRSLRIHLGRIDPNGLRLLNKLPDLEHLELTNTLSTDPDELYVDMSSPEYGLPVLAKKSKLRSLILSACVADAASLRVLEEHSKLEELSIYALEQHRGASGEQLGWLPAQDYASLARIKTLRSLTMASMELTPEFLESLTELEHLEKLALSSVSPLKSKDASFPFERMQNLRSLSLCGFGLVPRVYEAIARSKSLVELSLSIADTMTDSELERILALPRLRGLELVGCEQLTDAGFAPLEMTDLETLSLRCDEISSAAFAKLPPSVVDLTAYCDKLSRRCLDRLPRLRKLRIFVEEDAPQTIEALLDSDARERLEELVYYGYASALRAPERLAELSSLRVLDLNELIGSFDETLLAKLVAGGVEVKRGVERTPPEPVEIKMGGGR